MNTKTSFFNKRIFKRNLVQALPFVLLMAIICGWVLFSELTTVISTWEYMKIYEPDAAYATIIDFDIRGAILEFPATGACQVLMVGYSFICALSVFRYLFIKKTNTTLHALPLTRNCLFFTNTVSGLVLLAIPYAITTAANALYLAIKGLTFTALFEIFGVMFGYSFFFYSLTIFTIMLTGSIITLPIIYVFLNGVYLVSQLLFQIVQNVLYFGMYEGELYEKYSILAPFYHLYERLVVYNYRYTAEEAFSPYYDKAGIHSLWIYAAVAVVLLLLALLLYQKRQLERHGEILLFKPLETLFHYAGTFLGGAAASLIIFELMFFDVVDIYLETSHKIVLCVLFLVCSIAIYYIIEMFFRHTWKVFRHNYKGIAAYSALCTLLLVLLLLDAFGIENRRPETREIASMDYGTYGAQFHTKDEQVIQELLDIHKELIDSKDELIENLHSKYYTSDRYYTEIQITYHLKNGNELARSYPIILTSTTGQTSGSHMNSLWKTFLDLFSTPAALTDTLVDMKQKVSDISIWCITEYVQEWDEEYVQEWDEGVVSYEEPSIPEAHYAELLDAMIEDASSGALTYSLPMPFQETSSESLFEINLYHYDESYHTDDCYEYIVTEDCTHTLEIIYKYNPEFESAIRHIEEETEENP